MKLLFDQNLSRRLVRVCRRHTSSNSRSRQIAEAGRVMLRAENCTSVFAAWSACIRGVPGAVPATRNGGTPLVQRGLLIPAESASFSAVAASRLSTNGEPDGRTGPAMATPTSWGCRLNSSANARQDVQSGSA